MGNSVFNYGNERKELDYRTYESLKGTDRVILEERGYVNSRTGKLIGFDRGSVRGSI